MKQVQEETLIECVALLEDGQSIDQILARYPEQAAQLRPYLETAVHLSQFAPQPSLAAKRRSRRAFLEAAAERRRDLARPLSWYRWQRRLMPLASLVVVVLLIGVTLIMASGSALPGDRLYGPKRLIEDIRLSFTTNPEVILTLVEQFKAERIREVKALLRAGREAEVMFEGVIDDFQSEQWLVADIQVEVDEETEIEGSPQIGALASVYGRTHDGKLQAYRITVLTGGPPAPTLPEPSPTPTHTSTPEATDTPTMTPTNTPFPTNTPLLQPTPTADDGDGDEGNDNGNENGNDNDDENDNDDGNDNDDNQNNNDDNQNDNDDENDNDDDENSNNDNDNGNDNGNDNEENGNENGKE